ncbi:UDP-2,4-diacetamido-2,4,6-trideoxy-beta-L-altropyranose hydrolase [Kosakonia radicincitans]|uniref:UDP-2,4-diacetamido-2,4, 6-trideoxy-beta-L-altropyranose hydrolase n=1 Tax=Kosakonia radicincitans TaxID=283686 RepID=UPI0009A657BD|nr:UDP-2,4-diacetamido-2,4,6-trideoxy-beta-L-altropyranose hydrolase [Kosakonia radicincitans]SKC20590.1 UDP-2,4-diacetamido-2,4,6-trideoxy-beta-L-altropyranose hydrolase [Kosakonia radicincitans]
MKIAFRVDASLSIGSGHVVRCLNLADALTKKGIECIFITKAHSGNLIQLIKTRDYKTYTIPSGPHITDEYVQNEKAWLGGSQYDDALKFLNICQQNQLNPDALIIDHYSLDADWELPVHKGLPDLKIIVIDDLCNRKHFCHLLIDSTLERRNEEYSNLVPSDSLILAGTKYALLKEEFAQLRNQAILERTKISAPQKILITMGGVDINNITGILLDKINNYFEGNLDLITVVLGVNCPHKAEIARIAESCKYHIEVKININNMPQIMLEHDASIGALGSTTWERAVVGLPTINIAIADNQLVIVEKLKRKGFIVFDNTDFSGEDLYQAWLQLNIDYQNMVTRSFLLCDGGGLKRVVRTIINFLAADIEKE